MKINLRLLEAWGWLVESTSLISLKLALGASGLETGLFLVLDKNFINESLLDLRSEVEEGLVRLSFSGEAIRVLEVPRKIPEMVCIRDFLSFLPAFLLCEFDGDSSEISSFSADAISAAFLPPPEVFKSSVISGFFVVLREGLDGGMPNFAGSVRGVAGSDVGSVGGSVDALGLTGVTWWGVVPPSEGGSTPKASVEVVLEGIGGMELEGTATLVRRVRGLPEPELRLRMISWTTELCLRFKLLNLAKRSRGFRSW